ncbi:hypothetical protein ZIOFF_056793 [Zingiber officinale]|uniref:PRONE domain-containing protein n=1 Tax=Zingiber officinale TaxID=94328 RepID=A0A8J5FJD8_ZINOF|nr:hypothetical protein ZIOFF_056793 [Zingiber officinale]
MILVSKSLDGDNYSTWRRAMTISLNAKFKFCFVDGTLEAPSAQNKPEDYATWKKCNDMAYSSIIQEEKQRNLVARWEIIEASAMVVQKSEPVALAVRHKSSSSFRPNSNNRKPLHCSYCDRDHYVRETYWKLHGYPPGYPKHSTAKNNHFKHNDSNQSSIHNIRETPAMQQLQPIMIGLTELQLQQLLSIIQNNGTSQTATPKANNVTTSSGLSSPELIIDSDVTNPITSSSALLVNSNENIFLPPVVMLNGDQALIISIGNLPLSPIIYLKNVLVVPSCKVDLMSEKFAKLLLGEDMSGGGKGVPSSLALSNAITNLAVSSVASNLCLLKQEQGGEEIDWLLSVTDHVVELVSSRSMDGSNMEIMVTHQRRDLQANIPTLRKLDAMLLTYLDNFKDQNEFWYVSKDADEFEKGNTERNDDKWWLPVVKVPPNGLTEVSRKWLQFQKECVNQVLKAAMAINAHVLTEMEVPEEYIESLPKVILNLH